MSKTKKGPKGTADLDAADSQNPVDTPTEDKPTPAEQDASPPNSEPAAHAIALITGRYVEVHLCKYCTEKATDQLDYHSSLRRDSHGQPAISV